MIEQARLETLLEAFPKLSIGLVGDLFLDRYLEIDPAYSELSIETGLEAYQVARVRNQPGALGTVLNNLTALGVGKLVPVTVLGDDGQAYDLLQAMASMPVDTAHVLRDAARMTPTYTKPLLHEADGNWRELNRIDLRSRASLGDRTRQQLLANLDQVFEQTDGLIVLDQINEENWGVIDAPVRAHLAKLAARRPDKLIFCDSRARIETFEVGVLKPNLHECLRAVGRAPSDDFAEGRDAAAALAQLRGQTLFCTLGQRGMLVVEPGLRPREIPTFRVEGPTDIVGAGDSATSGIVASLLCGASLDEAATVGNLVASITVQQLGTTGTARPDQIRRRWQEYAAQMA